MSKKRIGDYIDYDFHTPNTKEVREFLEKGSVESICSEWSNNDEFITPSGGLNFIFTTNKEWGKFIPTEEFKQLIGMTKKEETVVDKGKQEGYQLADGTYSSEYKIGDKFEVVDIPSRDKHYRYKAGDIITFTEDDTTENPYFDDGQCVGWNRLKAYKPTTPQASQTAFTKSSLKDGMIVTTRNGNVYTVTGDRLLREGGMYVLLEDINDDLTSVLDDVRSLDIISVQQTVTLFKRETESEVKQQRIAKELEFAEAKRERLIAHIERLKKNLQS